MTIDEAIEHAEEVAKENDKLCKRYDDASGYTRSGIESLRTKDARKCEKCAEEHRQLAEWLRELKRNRDVLQEIREEIRKDAEWWSERDSTIEQVFRYVIEDIIDKHIGDTE